MNSLENLAGEICKALLPIPEEVYYGNKNSPVAVCTLSSIDLLKKFSEQKLLQNIAIVGRLLSENKGIEYLIHYVNKNPNIKKIILCGKEVWGHKAGHSLLELHKNGIDNNGRIINSTSPDPVLTLTESEVKKFQTQVRIVDMIGETNQDKIIQLIQTA
ncbi:MAG: tetrahydromethanopterin S-methyltransferase subunit A [Nitrosopumilaceae archaeon]